MRQENPLNITFFVSSVVGYVEHPAALFTRGLALGLAARGHEVRVVEQRRNPDITRTLETLGIEPYRHFSSAFSLFQHHTYERRTGAQLLEWISREIALIDVAVAVDGVDEEVCRWIANISRDGLSRVFLTWHPEQLTQDVQERLETRLFDVILAPDEPSLAHPLWLPISRPMAQADREIGLHRHLPYAETAISAPIDAANEFEQYVGNRLSPR